MAVAGKLHSYPNAKKIVSIADNTGTNRNNTFGPEIGYK
jgi:hypothetical protein